MTRNRLTANDNETIEEDAHGYATRIIVYETDDDTQCHGVQMNENETAEDEDTTAHSGYSNDNETVDDDVLPHGVQVNTNEAVEDEDVKRRLVANDAETVEET